MKELIVIMCTTKNIEEAREISKGLLREGLIACASIVQPVESWFVWQDKIEEVQEVQLFIKTIREKYLACEAWIVQNHSYEVPEIISLTVEKGYGPYLNWAIESVEST
ncbi:MAG: divalent-cation tolerance protein CutA [Chlamydiae bacterium]|nr:divalent-cation tolerance protein CutA [Chlamydiota bacterium]